ncbi:MAG: TIM barrel protein [Cytophagales bacterium]|nr:TIM barrel protein [Cytophagales bacterium]
MKHLTNFSVYEQDTNQFKDLLVELPQFLEESSLDGLELLIGYQHPHQIPPKLVTGVHLPFWVTWLDVWKQRTGALKRYFGDIDKAQIRYLCGGETPQKMIEALSSLWNDAARLNVAYAVIHACHVELEHAFTRKFNYSNHEVLSAFAELLNSAAAQFPAGEPPVTIAIENLWWPGLTFTDHRETRAFAEQLKFNNWCFVLDTGHLLNTNFELENEMDSIAYLKDRLDGFPDEIRYKIDVLHLSYSCSGAYQKQSIARGLPAGFHSLSLGDRYAMAREHASRIDRHESFSLRAISDLTDRIEPEFLVHEFLGPKRKREIYINQQRSLFPA